METPSDDNLSKIFSDLVQNLTEAPEVLAAQELRRVYKAFVEVGFTEEQAFQLLRDSMVVIQNLD